MLQLLPFLACGHAQKHIVIRFFYHLHTFEHGVYDSARIVLGEQHVAAASENEVLGLEKTLLRQLPDLLRVLHADKARTAHIHLECVVLFHRIVFVNLHGPCLCLEHIAHFHVYVGHAVVVAFVERDSPIHGEYEVVVHHQLEAEAAGEMGTIDVGLVAENDVIIQL